MKSNDAELEGYLDVVAKDRLFGWAWQSHIPNEPASVDLYADSDFILTITASLYRPDLENAGKGNGHHAFEIRLPPQYYDGQTHLVRLCYHGTDLDLHGSPQSICFQPKPGFAYRIHNAQERAQLDERIRQWDREHARDKPKVSVIIPCYNLGKYLDEAVDSVLEQTYQDLEIIIVNDGSTDANTNELLENYSRPRTTVVQTHNRGPGAARNAGIRIAKGSYLCALDADDKLHPTYLEKTVTVLDESDSVTFVSCWLQTFGDDDWIWKQDRCDLPALLGECTVATAALVRKSAVMAVGCYDEASTQWGNEDWLLWISIVAQGYHGSILPEVLFYYRKRSGSLSAFWMHGHAHLAKLSSVIAAQSESYRKHLIDVLSLKEAVICDLLRKNDRSERDIHWLRQQVESCRRQAGLLTARMNRSKVCASEENLQELEGATARATQRAQDLEREREELKQRVADLEIALTNVDYKMLEILNSSSWRITAPLRAINARLRLPKLWPTRRSPNE